MWRERRIKLEGDEHGDENYALHIYRTGAWVPGTSLAVGFWGCRNMSSDTCMVKLGDIES